MFSHPFEAALSQPESNASHAQLVTLLSIGDFGDPELPRIVEKYLNAFCDPSRSTVQRRWIGIILTRMLEKSDCVARIKELPELLKNLGTIIMSHEEQGVVKIIAGLIMRRGLEQNLDYHTFWPTDKLVKSAPSFPQQPDLGWTRNFLVFLDSLNGSAIKDSNHRADMSYIASIASSNGFSFGEPGNHLSVATLGAGILTILFSDVHLKNCHIVDIPFSHIIGTKLGPLRPRDLQTRSTECESCSVILSLTSEPWSYSLNSAQQTATEISLIFKHSKEATQWEDCIKQHQKAHETRQPSNHISSVHANPSSAKQEQQQKSTSSSSSYSLAEQSDLQKFSKTHRESLPPKSCAQLRQTRLQTSLEAEHTRSRSHVRGIECSKRGVPRASRVAKQNALKKIGLLFNKTGRYDRDERRKQTESDAPSAKLSAKGRLHHSKLAKGREASKNTKSGNGDVRSTAKDVEENGPTQATSKRKTSTKRKADTQFTKDGEQVNRSRKQSKSHADLTSTAAKEQDLSRRSTEPFSSASPSRRSLIEGLKASPEPADPDTSFKKPTLPAHATQTPSTPTMLKRKVVGTQRRLQTPRDARSIYGDVFSQMPSSPPIPYQLDERAGWLWENKNEAAILSSNSKPVPASPNAESTAISGHADSDDIASEKRTGDSQIAKSDPFSRRSKSGKVTSFLRRLTGENPADAASDPETEITQIAPIGNTDSSTYKSDTAMTANQPLPQATFSQKQTSGTQLTETINTCRQSSPNASNASIQVSEANHPTLVSTQEIDEADPGMESDHLNSGFQDDQQDSSEFDLPPVYLSSSPPRLGSPTSHSSTSATPFLSSRSALPSSEANEIEFETSLESCYHDLNNSLACTSKGVLRHIIDTDTGCDDIAETFVKDSDNVLQSL